MHAEYIPCYIVNLNTDSKVVFSIELPETISDSYSANYSDQVTRGRSSPFKSYESSGPRSISFSVMLSYDYHRDLKDIVSDLRNMLKPQQGSYINPPRVKGWKTMCGLNRQNNCCIQSGQFRTEIEKG